MAAHPIQRRFWAESLLCVRRPDEQRRYASAQRQGKIDANPHQVDAVVFALQRLREGGCILADEVGLGKTIEAGLVIAQLLAEGTRRVLIVLPKALVGQWQNELLDLFRIEASADGPTRGFQADGVYLVGREFAGGARAAELIAEAPPFDLLVIDEAHEMFANIWRRYDSSGDYREDEALQVARTAHRVRELIMPGTSVLLLTATPIQNSLLELWGLVQFVDRSGTLLGDLPTFKEMFCEPSSNHRVVRAEQADELRQRIERVCQRTLRRQAQAFLDQRFTRRTARLFRYRMSAAERELYDAVTDYLLAPNLCAFAGGARQLLLIGFHRRMASSVAALRSSLEAVVRRLRAMLEDDRCELASADRALARDLDLAVPLTGGAGSIQEARVRQELEQVQRFITQCDALPTDTKAERLLAALRLVLARATDGQGSGKVIVFTESLQTQAYLERLLLASDLGLNEQDITLFCGNNDGARAAETYAAWCQAEPSRETIPQPIGMRLALVDEFRCQARVFISTEAGAKGLNLQFCDTVVNYDLPWNPQRIEQRIGRSHRYGQQFDVTVINFLATDNESERRMHEILCEKLELFGTVLDASDEVLHQATDESPEGVASTIGSDFELGLRQAYERARTREELAEEIERLGSDLERRKEAYERVQQRTASLIESLDESVQQAFRRWASDLPHGLAELDREMEQTVIAYLEERTIEFRRDTVDGRTVLRASGYEPTVIGSACGRPDLLQLSLSHPLVEDAVAEARAAQLDGGIRIALPARRELDQVQGQLAVTKVCYQGLEPVERLLVTVLREDGTRLDLTAKALFSARIESQPGLTRMDEMLLADAVAEDRFDDQLEVEAREQALYEQVKQQLERYVEDRVLVLRGQVRQLGSALTRADREWQNAQGPKARGVASQKRSKVETELQQAEKELAAAEARELPLYRQWAAHTDDRRYQQPVCETILNVPFVIDASEDT